MAERKALKTPGVPRAPRLPSIISHPRGYVDSKFKQKISTTTVDSMVANDSAEYKEKLNEYARRMREHIDIIHQDKKKIGLLITSLKSKIDKAINSQKSKDEEVSPLKRAVAKAVKKMTPDKTVLARDGLSRSIRKQESYLIDTLKSLVTYAEGESKPGEEGGEGIEERKEEAVVEAVGEGSETSPPIGSMELDEDRPRGRGNNYVNIITPGQNTEPRTHGSGMSVTSATDGGERTPVRSTDTTNRQLFRNTVVTPSASDTVVSPAAPVATAFTTSTTATDTLDAGGEAKRLQSVVDNVEAMENFMIGKSEKQLYYMPVPMKTALEKAEKSDMLRVINKTIREYGAVIGITECTVDMQNSHSELASYYDILVHCVKGWADSVATLNDPDTPLWKYNPDVLLERRVAYENGLAEYQKQLHKDSAVMGAEAQRSPAEENRIAADKMMVAKRKFEKVTSSDRLKSDNSEAGNRRLAHMFLKSVPPLHMFKKDLAPTSHMSQAPQSQRKMRKVLHNPLQMGPPIVIEFNNVMLKTTNDTDEEY